MQLSGLLFDYGGTLDGAASHWLDRFVALYRDAGLDLPFERIKDAFYRADDAAYGDPDIPGSTLRELMDFHVRTQLAVLELDDTALHRHLVDRFIRRSEAALCTSRHVLSRLSRRFRLGIVSNFYGNVERVLEDAGLTPFLSVIVDSARVGLRKPDPRIFLHAVAQLGSPAAETLHVGDSYERDVVPAHRAGLRTAWLGDDRSGGPKSPDRNLADLRLRSLDELLVHLSSP